MQWMVCPAGLVIELEAAAATEDADAEAEWIASIPKGWPEKSLGLFSASGSEPAARRRSLRAQERRGAALEVTVETTVEEIEGSAVRMEGVETGMEYATNRWEKAKVAPTTNWVI